VGQAIIVAAKAAGAAAIVAVDRKPKRLELAEKNGATVTINATADHAMEQIVEFLPQGIDALFDCAYEYAGKSRPGTRHLADGGRAILVGVPGSDDTRAAL